MAPLPSTFPFDHAGLELRGYHWPAGEQADAERGVLAIVHGLGEHAGRYAHCAEHFNAAGYEVFAFDQEGHGRSAGKRGAIRSWPLTVASVNSFLAAVRLQLEVPAVPVSLWGHSMGALLALDYLDTRPEAEQLRAAVVTAPPLALAFEPSPVLVRAAGLLAKALPNVTKANDLDARDLSRDAGVVSLYSVDPLVHRRVSMRLGEALLSRGRALLRRGYHARVPLLLMHGTRDAVTSAAGSARFAEISTGPVTYRPWEGFFHELHNEPERREVLDAMSAFLATTTRRPL